MTDEAILEAVQVLNPRTLGRARRLSVALALLRAGQTRIQACAALRLRFAMPRCEAWRLVDMASDMAGKPKEKK